METDWAQKMIKNHRIVICTLKQNIKLHEFITTEIKNTNTEFKLYTIGYNLKRIYNEINRKKQLKIRKNIKNHKTQKSIKNFASHPQVLFAMFFAKKQYF